MLIELFLAIVQAATEFLPISSSGHLALLSNILDKPDIFYFTILHLASLLAVVIFTRREIKELFTFKPEYKKLWSYLIIATIPAIVIALLFREFVLISFSSFLIIGISYLFTGSVLLLTKYTRPYARLNWKNSLFIGLFQALALFPGISRSGMTISSALFSGIEREKAVKFSLLMFIPIGLAAFISEFKQVYLSFTLIIPFLTCFILSLVFLNLLMYSVKKKAFWLFSVYCFLIGILSLILHFS